MSENYHQIPESKGGKGHVCSPGLLCGSIGLLLALILQKFGFFEMGNSALYRLLEANLTLGVPVAALSLITLAVVAAIYSIGIAWSILDSRGAWRRVLIWMTAMILVIVTVPTLAVWSIYFSPFLVLTSVFLSSLCAMVYAARHRMSCDLEN